MLLGVPVLAQDAPDVQAQMEVLRSQVQEQSRLHTQDMEHIRKQRTELGRGLAREVFEVEQLRKSSGEASTLLGLDATGFDRLKTEIGELEQELKACSGELDKYMQGMPARLGQARSENLRNTLAGLEKQRVEIDENVRIGDVVRVAQAQNLRRVGVDSFAGKCLDDAGVVFDGEFVTVGPNTYFYSMKTGFAGVVDAVEDNTAYPRASRRIHFRVLERLMTYGRDKKIPIDFSGGNAGGWGTLFQKWLAHLVSGGIVMIPILALGAICFVFALFKLVALGRLRTKVDVPIEKIVGLIKEGKEKKAVREAEKLGSPIGPVIAEGVKLHGVSREHLEEVMHEKVLFQVPVLERLLPFLAVSAAVAPLLGLLGTVTGMIRTFKILVLSGAGNVDMLMGGISQALVTTEYGLVVAVPVLLLHSFLSRKVKIIIFRLEQAAVSFINAVKRDDENVQ